MRPLVRRNALGVPYVIVPSAPQHREPEPTRQPKSDTPSGPSPTTRPQEGQGLGRAKLTDDEVRTIRAHYAAGKWTRKDLAYIYDVGVAAIGNALRVRVS